MRPGPIASPANAAQPCTKQIGPISNFSLGQADAARLSLSVSAVVAAAAQQWTSPMTPACHARRASHDVAHARRHHAVRLSHRADRLRTALVASASSSRRCRRRMAGAATCSRSPSRFRICCGASASRSPARSPTGSARCACCAPARCSTRAGLALMAYTTTPVTLQLSAGVLIGFGLSGCSFNLVIAAFGKLLAGALAHAGVRRRHRGGLVRPVPVLAARRRADRLRRLAERAGHLRRPAAAHRAVVARARDAASKPKPAGPASAPPQSLTHALTEAFAHRSYVLLVLGFFTCGFQLAFITVHLPAYLVDRGLSSAQVGGWTLATIGLFNIVGSLSVRLARRHACRSATSSRSSISCARCAIVAFILLPASPATTLVFGAVIGPAVALHRAADLGRSSL